MTEKSVDYTVGTKIMYIYKIVEYAYKSIRIKGFR